MEHPCAHIADLSLRLKRQYRILLAVSPGYGADISFTREVDNLGLLIKELEDSVVVLQIKLEKRTRRRRLAVVPLAG